MLQIRYLESLVEFSLAESNQHLRRLTKRIKELNKVLILFIWLFIENNLRIYTKDIKK